MSPSRILVWDLPTRLFHWLLTVGFLFTFAAAQWTDEHSPWFSAHMIVGLVLGLMIAMRVAWGIVGSKYARFDSFAFGPAALLSYIQGAFTGRTQRYAGHNPGSSYAIFAMLILIGAAVVTGLMRSSGGEAAEELHAAFAYAAVAVVAIHIVGVAWHSVRHRENITLSMITGTKEGSEADAIRSSRPIAGLVFLAVVALAMVSLFANYDPAKGQTKIPLINTVISLGEGGENERHGDD